MVPTPMETVPYSHGLNGNQDTFKTCLYIIYIVQVVVTAAKLVGSGPTRPTPGYATGHSRHFTIHYITSSRVTCTGVSLCTSSTIRRLLGVHSVL